MFGMFYWTAVVPVHVNTCPTISEAAEQVIIAKLNGAIDIIDKAKQKIAVRELMEQLKKDPSEQVKDDIERQLITEFSDALSKEGFQQSFLSSVASMLARTTVNDISLLSVRHGDSIVVYFLCEALCSLNELRLMITSRFMHEVFIVIIEAEPDTDIDVYIRDRDFNSALQCLSGPQIIGL